MRSLLHSIYSPACWMLLISLIMLIYFLRRTEWKSRSRWGRVYIFGYALGWSLFYLVSTPFGSNWIHGTLIVEDPGNLMGSEEGHEQLFPPEYILVAAMGYLISEDSATDVLRDGTALRVATAAKLFKKFPDTRIVMQGAGINIDGEVTARIQEESHGKLWDENAAGRNNSLLEKSRQLDHQGKLMKAFAMSLGVPEERILLEPYSTNTREHVERILGFDNINAETPIAVVSSDWHMRRIRMVFAHAFEHVRFYGTAEYSRINLSIGTLLPRERDLYASSVYLREWVAICWYKISGKDHFEKTEK